MNDNTVYIERGKNWIGKGFVIQKLTSIVVGAEKFLLIFYLKKDLAMYKVRAM